MKTKRYNVFLRPSITLYLSFFVTLKITMWLNSSYPLAYKILHSFHFLHYVVVSPRFLGNFITFIPWPPCCTQKKKQPHLLARCEVTEYTSDVTDYVHLCATLVLTAVR
uniref:Hypothetical transmembrane protein n=1 Tax=Trypanosoma brucei TaxID=5691 RepID=Q8WPQ1_9TRYP|nr:hypothetical transmembrane protein [Trypanosoma brucei]